MLDCTPPPPPPPHFLPVIITICFKPDILTLTVMIEWMPTRWKMIFAIIADETMAASIRGQAM